MATRQEGVAYLNQLADQYEQSPTPELQQEIARVAEALDPGGQMRSTLSAEDQRSAEAREATGLERFSTGVEEAWDRTKTATSQLFQEPEERQQTYQDYLTRSQERQAMLDTPSGAVGEYGTLALPAVAATGAAIMAPQVSLPAAVGIGAGSGAAEFALTNPSEGEDFWQDKARDALIGGSIGGVAPLVGPGIKAAGRLAGRGGAEASERISGLLPNLGSDAPADRVIGPAPLLQAPGADDAARLGTRESGSRMVNLPEFDVDVLPSRYEYMTTGNIGPLAAENAGRRQGGTLVQQAIDADRRATQEGVEAALRRNPGGGGFSTVDADEVASKLLSENSAREAAEAAAWKKFRDMADDPVLMPSSAKQLFEDLHQTLVEQRPNATMTNVAELDRYLRRQAQSGEGLTASGIDNLRRDLQGYTGAIGTQEGAVLSPVKKRLDNILSAVEGDSRAVGALKDALRSTQNYRRFASGTEYNKAARKSGDRQLSVMVQKLLKGETPEALIEGLLRNKGVGASKFLQDIADEFGDEVAGEMQEVLRKAAVGQMTKGKLTSTGELKAQEGYKALADQMDQYMTKNRRAMEELFEQDELDKWQRFVALNRGLASPNNTDNWSGTSGTLRMLQQMENMPIGPVSGVASGVGRLLKPFAETGVERNIGRATYGPQWDDIRRTMNN